MQERGFAITLAQAAMPADAVDVLGNPGGEVLLVDRPSEAHKTDRRVTVALFDYTRQQTTQLLVNLSRIRVDEQHSTTDVQLPPSTAEVHVSLQLALEARPAPRFLTEFRRLTGTELRVPEQVDVRGGIWLQAEENGQAIADACETQRCLQLLVSLPSGQFLDTHDFAVNLSKRTVIDAEGNRPHEH